MNWWANLHGTVRTRRYILVLQLQALGSKSCRNSRCMQTNADAVARIFPVRFLVSSTSVNDVCLKNRRAEDTYEWPDPRLCSERKYIDEGM